MKQETNNEIDLLLRRLSRREGASALDGDHLDADELSAYAENALPVAARARYTEHLAECSRCRLLVVQLSSAAGVMVAEEPARIPAPSGLSRFLAGLFSPMVLRYAVPALGLVIVAVIGFTVFRSPQPGSPEMVATHRAADTPAVAPEAKPQPDGLLNRQEKFGSPAPTPQLRGQRKEEVEAPAPNATPAATATTDFAAEPPAPKTESQPVTTTAAASPAPAAPKPAETADEVKRLEPAARQDAQGRTATANEAEKDKATRTRAAETEGAGATRRPAKTGALTSAATPGPGATVEKFSEDAQKDRDEAEIRSVAGRRFRKKDGVWVDTAYAGGATMDLPRGSERFRSLVADEPAIKNIAEQLDGQIIVVWKGRAYRIH